MKKRNPDTGKTVALLALVGAVGYGIYLWVKGKEIPPPPPPPTGAEISGYSVR